MQPEHGERIELVLHPNVEHFRVARVNDLVKKTFDSQNSQQSIQSLFWRVFLITQVYSLN